MIFIVELTRVSFVADGAVKEADGGGEGVVAWWHCEKECKADGSVVEFSVDYLYVITAERSRYKIVSNK